MKTGRPPITVRWVEVNKGEDDNPNYRSRFFAREIRMAGEDSIFTPTPPLESLRMVLSYETTDFPDEPKKVHDSRSPHRTQFLAIDILRAYVNAVTLGGRLGPGPKDSKEISMLNRIVRWTTRGIEYEANPRQVEKLLWEIELEGAISPDSEPWRFERITSPPTASTSSTRPRVCRFMSRLTDIAIGALTPLARYLRSRPRMVFDFEFQAAEGLECYTDTDWAGCARIWKRTSEGCLMSGQHLIKAWSRPRR